MRSALWEQLAEVAEKKPDALVIDLAAVTFLDCGTAVMMIQTGRLLASGRKPVLRYVRLPAVLDQIDLINLDLSGSWPEPSSRPQCAASMPSTSVQPCIRAQG